MYAVSSAFRNKQYSGESEFKARLVIGETEIPNDQIARIEIDNPIFDSTSENNNGIFYIGTFISQKVTIKFKNLDGLDLHSGDNVELYISQYVNDEWVEIPMGLYLIDDLAENYHETCEISCLDYAVKFKNGIDYSPCFVDDKATVDTILQYICTTCGVTLGSYPSINGNIETGQYDSTVSGKQWISYIAELKGCNAKIGRDGVLNLIPLCQEPAVSINALESESWKLGEKYEISKVRFDNGLNAFTKGDETENTLYIRQDNPFVLNQETVDNIYDSLFREDGSEVEVWYEFTRSVVSGTEYLIVNENTVDAKSINSDLSNPQIQFDVAPTDNVWIFTESGSGYTIRNKVTNKYLGYETNSSGVPTSLGVHDEPTVWTWNSSNGRLSVAVTGLMAGTYYIRYYNNSWSINRSTGSNASLYLAKFEVEGGGQLPTIIYSLETRNYGDISLDAWDIINYTLGDKSYPTYNNNKLTFEMSIMSDTKTQISSKQQEETTNYIGGNTSTQVRKLKTTVNALDNKITLEAEQIDTSLTAQEGRISSLEINTNSISSSVSSLQTLSQEQYEQLSDDLDNYKTLTDDELGEINSKFDDYATKSDLVTIETSVNTITTDTYTKTEINSFLVDGSVKKLQTTSMTADENGLTFAKTNAKTTSNINESGLSIMDENGNPILRAIYDDDIKNTIVETYRHQVQEYFIMGSHSRFEDYEDGTGVFYIS